MTTTPPPPQPPTLRGLRELTGLLLITAGICGLMYVTNEVDPRLCRALLCVLAVAAGYWMASGDPVDEHRGGK